MLVFVGYSGPVIQFYCCLGSEFSEPLQLQDGETRKPTVTFAGDKTNTPTSSGSGRTFISASSSAAGDRVSSSVTFRLSTTMSTTPGTASQSASLLRGTLTLRQAAIFRRMTPTMFRPAAGGGSGGVVPTTAAPNRTGMMMVSPAAVVPVGLLSTASDRSLADQAGTSPMGPAMAASTISTGVASKP